KQMAENRKRILVVGFYLASSAKSVDQMGSRMSSFRRFGGRRQGNAEEVETTESRSLPEGIEIIFSEKRVIDHSEMPTWVLQSATEALPSESNTLP
ncbi:MAG: hypothetical protein LBJ67_00270, partial [Planctomycetaceae bacterium]|nr:hypothetical protein [Planctomycetaceae bacterium]